MKRNIFLLTVSLFLAIQSTGQNHEFSIWVKLNSGFCVTENYDNGTVPFTDIGVGLVPGIGTVAEWDEYRAEVDLRVPVSVMLTMGGYDIPIDSRLEFLYRIYNHPKKPFHVWVGGGLQALVDIKYSPALMNASVSASSFVNLLAIGGVSYDFASLHGGPHKLFTAHAKLSIPLYGTAERPGFAYMNNYTSDINIANTLFQDQEIFLNCFAGLNTDLGLTLNLTNGNRIGLSYRWDYLTTAHRGTYRFDNAIHSLNLTCLFNLY